MTFSFKITAKDKNSRARAGVITTAHGKMETPYLIPVATRGQIIFLTNSDLEKIKPQALLANTYHLYLLKYKEIKKARGLHNFMNFHRPIFTDSGGFQAFSLGWGKVHGVKKIGFFPEDRKTTENEEERLAIVTEEGVKFKSVYDNSEHFITPEKSMEIQSNLGADIIMAFDECTSPRSNKSYTKKAVDRTHKWAIKSLKNKDPRQALYGIIQGGYFKDLRIKSTKFISSLPFEGIAIGGSLGNTKENMHEVLDWITPLLDNRPRHMLGIGRIDDLFECVARGIDTFDCVDMTRVARHKHLYISPNSGGLQRNKFRIAISKKQYEKDNKPIDKKCTCQTCKSRTRADVYKLFKTDKAKYYRVATVHNVSFMNFLCAEIRASIKQGTFKKLKKEWLG